MAGPPSIEISAIPWLGPLGQMTRTPVPESLTVAVSPAVLLKDSVCPRSPLVHVLLESACVHDPL